MYILMLIVFLLFQSKFFVNVLLQVEGADNIRLVCCFLLPFFQDCRMFLCLFYLNSKNELKILNRFKEITKSITVFLLLSNQDMIFLLNLFILVTYLCNAEHYYLKYLTVVLLLNFEMKTPVHIMSKSLVTPLSHLSIQSFQLSLTFKLLSFHFYFSVNAGEQANIFCLVLTGRNGGSSMCSCSERSISIQIKGVEFNFLLRPIWLNLSDFQNQQTACKYKLL